MSRLPDNDHIIECRETRRVLVNAQTTRSAEEWIISCEDCSPDTSEVLFDSILDSITGCDPKSTDYVLSEPAQCPTCGARLHTGYWRWTESETESEDEGRTV